VLCLFGCQGKQELGFLGNIEVGKYEIVQYREYPNGTKDTLIWEAYGPLYLQEARRYNFNIDTTTIFYRSCQLLEDGISFIDYNNITDGNRSYTSEIQSLSGDEILLNYSYYVNNSGIVSDSANGHITFKRIPQ
jgi:hypothetical protein